MSLPDPEADGTPAQLDKCSSRQPASPASRCGSAPTASAEYLTLGQPRGRLDAAMAQRELAVVLRDVDLGTWRPPRPDPAPAKDVDPTFHEFASDWFATKRARGRAEHRQQLPQRPHQPPAAVLQGPPPLADHGRRGRPLPPEQGARGRRDHGGRRERDADDGRPTSIASAAATAAARAPCRRARSTCTSTCWRRSSPSPSTTATSRATRRSASAAA